MTWLAPASEVELRGLLAEGATRPRAARAEADRGLAHPGAVRPGAAHARATRVPTGGGERPLGPVSTARDAGGAEDRTREERRQAAVAPGDVGVISLEAPSFARVVEYEPKDLTITVGAGMRLDALRDTLQSQGQWLPPGSWGRQRSVGGLVGAGSPGPFDAAFGSVRRHVLAVRTTTWDGRSLTWGRAVVKNVAGYDLKCLWCGSRGRLGLVTQTSLRVWPQPEHREWLEVRGSAPGWRILESLAVMEAGEDFQPDACLWSGATSTWDAYALVGLLGSEAGVRSRGARVREWAARHGFEVGEGVSGAAITGRLASLEPGSRSLSDVAFRVHCRRADLAGVARRLARTLADTAGALHALPELGVLRVSYRRPDDEARAAATRAALFQAAGGASIAMETGGPEEIAAGEARREDSVRVVERSVLEALGGAPRHWLADYV